MILPFLIRTTLSLLAVLAFSQPVQAVAPVPTTPTMPFSNLSDARTTAVVMGGIGAMSAVATSVGSVATTITNFVVPLRSVFPSIPLAPLVAKVCADNAGFPNLDSCQVFTTTATSVPVSYADFSYTGSYSATANATVWIVLISAGTGFYDWGGSTHTPHTFYFSSDFGVSWQTTLEFELLYSISGVPTGGPTASAVSITGTPQVGGTLTGSYTYTNASGALEANSTMRWMSSSSADGSNRTAIAGATAKTYSPVATDGGNYLFYCVTPAAQTGTLTGTEVCSGGVQFVLVSNITSATAVPGIGPNQVAPLDLSTGYGTTLTNCLMATLRQLLGQDAVYVGQVSGGGVRVAQGGKIISFYALSAGGDASQSQGIHLLSGNALNLGTNCGNLNVAPALYNPTEFGAALSGMGLSASIDATGTITISGNGSVYAVRPDFFVTPGQPEGTGLKLGADGLYRFTDSAGNSQVLRAAFLSPTALQASAGAAVGGSLVIQLDGTALFTRFNGTQLVFSPDLTLGSIPAAFAQSSWWTDGTNHYRYPIGFASQGLTQTAK